MVSNLNLLIIVSKFSSHWIPHVFGLMLKLSLVNKHRMQEVKVIVNTIESQVAIKSGLIIKVQPQRAFLVIRCVTIKI